MKRYLAQRDRDRNYFAGHVLAEGEGLPQLVCQCALFTDAEMIADALNNQGAVAAARDRGDQLSVVERCARALYAQAGKEWLKSYPWESEHRIAVEARERAMEQAKVALEAVNHEGAAMIYVVMYQHYDDWMLIGASIFKDTAKDIKRKAAESKSADYQGMTYETIHIIETEDGAMRS